MRQQLLPFDVDALVDDAVEGLARRPDDAAHAEQVVAKRADPASERGGIAGLDVVVELVDLVVEGVDRVEERLGDGVRECGHDRARAARSREIEVDRRSTKGLSSAR